MGNATPSDAANQSAGAAFGDGPTAPSPAPDDTERGSPSGSSSGSSSGLSSMNLNDPAAYDGEKKAVGHGLSSTAPRIVLPHTTKTDRFAHDTPTIEDVARHAGVSRQTVSNVLNAPDRVRPETIERVRHAVDLLGYRANRNARNLRTRTSRVIGYRIPPLDARGNFVLDTFLHAMTEAVEELGYHVLLFTSDSREREIATYWELNAQSAVDGVVLAQTDHHDARPAPLLTASVPFVSFGRTWGNDDHSWVDVDGRAGTRLAVEHLLRKGHRRFAWLGANPGTVGNDEREGGVKDALIAAGLGSELTVVNLRDDPASDRRDLGQLLDSVNAPTAFVAISDLQALTVLSEFESRSLIPGSDADVIGFDDTPVASYAGGGLTSVRQPIGLVAKELARLLALQFADSTSAPEGVLLTPELVVRRTA